jgi:ankyrin repeat protein
MPNSELAQESKLQRGDKADIIYIITDGIIFSPYQDLFDNSGLNCRKILVNPIIMEEQLSQVFQHHAPYTKIYVFMHGDVSDTGRFLLNLGYGYYIEAAELIHIINTMTVYPVHMSFISCHSGVLLESHLKEDTLFLKSGSTIVTSGFFASVGAMFFPRIECEVKELKSFLWNERYSYREFIKNSVIKGILSCPEDLQFLMMGDLRATYLNIPAITDLLTENELSSHLAERVRMVISFFENISPLPKDVSSFFLNSKLRLFKNHLFFLHFNRALHPEAIDSISYIDDYLIQGGDLNIRSFLPGIEGETPVIYASSLNNLEWLKKFIAYGANMHAATREGITAFYYAAQYGYIPIIRYCLSQHVDVNQKAGNGQTSLYAAVGFPRSDAIVRLLCEHGADPNIQTDDGYTPLMLASQNGDYTIVRELIKCGADLHIKSNFGHTALSVATAPGIIDLLHYVLARQNAVMNCYNTLLSHIPFSAEEIDMQECDIELLPEEAQNEDSPEECNTGLLSAEGRIENNPASFSFTAGAAVGFWQEPKSTALKITYDKQDIKPEQDVQAESEPHLNSNFDSQLMLGAVLVKIAVDVITWGIQWWNGETKQPVEEYISAEERTLFIESSEKQLTALYQELLKLPDYDFNEFMHAELEYDLDHLKSRDAITIRELEQFEREMADFKQELIEEKEFIQAKNEFSDYKHREWQSKQSFFQSPPL